METAVPNSDKPTAEGMAVTLGEVYRMTQSINSNVNQLKGEIVTQKELNVIHERVADVESNIRWIVRVIIGAVIMAVLGLVLLTP